MKDLVYKCETPENKKIEFARRKDGLHVYNCAKHFQSSTEKNIFGHNVPDNKFLSITGTTHVTMSKQNNVEGIDTEEKSKARFSARDQEQAAIVRRFQHVSGHPSDETITYSVSTNGVQNSPITKRDVKLANDMLGRSKFAIHGKTVKSKPDAVNAKENIVAVPPTIMEYYKEAELSVDVMHVNKIPFLVTVSKHIHFITVNALENMKMITMAEVLRQVKSSYSIQGFNIILIHVDIQFKAL